jgi:hypothetical protein
MGFGEFLGSDQPAPTEEHRWTARVLIFDQFEELFSSFQERWQEREGFFDDLGDALDTHHSLHIVISMREEFIGHLERYSSLLPTRARIRYRLERLRQEAALDAICEPLKDTGRQFHPDAAAALVRNLLKVPVLSPDGSRTEVAGEFVEPVHLQVVCQTLWHALPVDIREIDSRRIEDFGDVDRALETFYDGVVRRVSSAHALSEGYLRHWFGTVLITPAGTRNTVFRLGDVAGGISSSILRILENEHIIRAEIRAGSTWYELTHDRLIAPILTSNQKWRESRKWGRWSVDEIESRASAWRNESKSIRAVLTARELGELDQWFSKFPTQELGFSSFAIEYIEESKRILRERLARRRRNLVGGITLVVVLLLALWLVYGSIEVTQESQRQEGRVASILSMSSQRRREPEFEALVLGLRAVGRKSIFEPPPEATKGLTDAITAVGPAQWLWRWGGGVSTAIFSPDGAYLLTANQKLIRIWDTATLQPRWTKHAPNGGIWISTFTSPDWKKVVAVSTLRGEEKTESGSDDRREKSTSVLWDVKSGQVAGLLRKNIGKGTFFYSDDGRFMACHNCGGQGWTIRDAKKGQLQYSLSAAAERGEPKAVSAKAALVLWADESNELYVVDHAKDEWSRIDIGSTGATKADANFLRARFSPDGKYLALWWQNYFNANIHPLLVGVRDGKQRLLGDTAPAEVFFGDADGVAIVTTISSGIGGTDVQVVEADNGTVRFHGVGGLRLAAMSDSERVAFWSPTKEGTRIEVMDIRSGERHIVRDGLPNGIQAAAVSNDLETIFTADANTSRIWRTGAGRMNGTSLDELRRNGCDALRPRWQEVSDICN